MVSAGRMRCGGEAVRQREQQHIAAVALHQGPDRAGPLAEDQVAFPVPGHRPVGRLGGSLADVEGVAQLASALGQPLASWVAHRPTRPQAALQLTAQRAAALDEQRQVDRLVRHPHHRILRVGQRQPPGDLLRRPPQRQLGLHHRPQPRLGHQLGRLGAGPAGRPRRRRPGPGSGRPPFLASSRDTVDGARPSRAAICRHGSPAATPRLISSRSAMLRHRGARRGGCRCTPPVWNTNARTDGPRLPSRRAISRSDSPCRQRAHTSSCSAADSPQDRTHHLHRRRIRQCGGDATTH